MTTLRTSPDEPTVLDVACPACNAKPGVGCMTRTGGPHATRVEQHKLHVTELRRLRAWNDACNQGR